MKSISMELPWYALKNDSRLLTPALLFYPERISNNINRMVDIAGQPERLRPHVKTYKCREIVSLQMEAGIQKFKCATLAEAQMLGEVGVEDVLIAYPLVGPAQEKFIALNKAFPYTRFSVLIDNVIQLSQWNGRNIRSLPVFIDLDVGMERTGIKPKDALGLIEKLGSNYEFKGFHVYDGHIHDADPIERAKQIEKSLNPVWKLLGKIDRSNWGEIIFGGSISFPHHAKYPDRHLSPGTTLLWDQGYSHHFPDLPFDIAATVATRIVSKPGKEKLCLDLGYKAIASEMKHQPIFFPQLEAIKIVNWSEEHLVLETPLAGAFQIGDLLYGFPWHICPTVALHNEVLVVQENQIVDTWGISSRSRFYQI